MISLRREIVGRIFLTLVAVGLASIIVSYEAARYEADEFMDDYLRQFAEAADPRTNPAIESAPLLEPEDRFERLIWKNGSQTFVTRSAPKIAAEPDYVGFRDLAADGEAWRVFVKRRGAFVLMLAQRDSARTELAQHTAFEIALVILTTMVIVWLIVRWTVGRILRRLNTLGARIAERSVDATDLLPVDALPREITPLVEAMNVLIERLQAALRQQRRFIADSAHELRTPLTALRLQIENLKGDAQGQSAATEALQDGITRASAVLNQLLRLARFEGSATSEPAEAVDLGDLVKQCVANTIVIADDASIDIGITNVEPAVVTIVRSDLQILISNVIDNAIRYTPAGGIVDCEVRRQARSATIKIIDTGPGVADADIPRLTERFFRAAHIDIPGSGLGLSIAQAIADAYRLTLTIENRLDRRGLIVGISFPSDLLVASDGRVAGNAT